MNKKKKIKKVIIFLILITVFLFTLLFILNNNVNNEYKPLDKTMPELYEGKMKYKNVEELFIFKTKNVMATDIAKDVGDFYQNKLPKMQEDIKNLKVNQLEENFDKFTYLNGKFITINLKNFIILSEKLNNITFNLDEYEYCEFKSVANNAVEVECFYKNENSFKICLAKNGNSISIIAK